jgi:hypothetical protein
MQNQQIHKIPNFLTYDECQEYINIINKEEQKWKSQKYPNQQNNTKRYQKPIMGTGLREKTWEKLQPYKLLFDGMTQENVLSHYYEGQYVILHKDMPFHKPPLHSTHTMIIYLNNCKGGETIYYPEATEYQRKNVKYPFTSVPNYKGPIISVKPEEGMAVIFDLKLLHKSAPALTDKWLFECKLSKFTP